MKSQADRSAVNRDFWQKLAFTAACLWLNFTNAHADVWRFALIGDTPYSSYERAELPLMLDHIAASGNALVIHVGDIKHGKDRCDDALFDDRLALFDNAALPFIFAPGDNEWSDCDRLNNGGYDPLERLRALRKRFWSTDSSLGRQRLPLSRQGGGWPEHSRFRLGPVLFVTLNLPGGNNNWGPAELPSAEYRQRQPQVTRWLRESFTLARQEGLRGIALLFQANPGFRHFNQGLGHRGYREFLEVLREESQNFDGQVLVVHGDTHTSRIDQPLRDAQGKPISRLTRVETFGYPVMGWTQGRIDSNDPKLFSFEPHPWPSK